MDETIILQISFKIVSTEVFKCTFVYVSESNGGRFNER